MGALKEVCVFSNGLCAIYCVVLFGIKDLYSNEMASNNPSIYNKKSLPSPNII